MPMTLVCFPKPHMVPQTLPDVAKKIKFFLWQEGDRGVGVEVRRTDMLNSEDSVRQLSWTQEEQVKKYQFWDMR